MFTPFISCKQGRVVLVLVVAVGEWGVGLEGSPGEMCGSLGSFGIVI